MVSGIFVTEEYLDQVSRKSGDLMSQNNEADFQDRWRCLYQCVIEMQCEICRKVFKLTHKQCRVEDFLHDKDIQHYVH